MFALDKPLTWLIILLIVLLIFGAGKLPDIGKSLGRSIKEFKDETKTGMANNPGATTTTTTTSPPAGATGSVNAGATANGVATGDSSVRRRIIKHPDGREEIIEERV